MVERSVKSDTISTNSRISQLNRSVNPSQANSSDNSSIDDDKRRACSCELAVCTRGDALTNIGDVGVYYIKKEATNLLSGRVSFPKQLTDLVASSDGIIHQFSEKINMHRLRS